MRSFLQKISGGTQILLFYSCLPNKTATFYPNKKSLSGGGLLSYKKSLKVDDEVKSSEKVGNSGQHQQKLGISLDVLDSAKALLVERYMQSRRADLSTRG